MHFAYSLKFIGNPQIDTSGALAVLLRHRQRGRNVSGPPAAEQGNALLPCPCWEQTSSSRPAQCHFPPFGCFWLEILVHETGPSTGLRRGLGFPRAGRLRGAGAGTTTLDPLCSASRSTSAIPQRVLHKVSLNRNTLKRGRALRLTSCCDPSPRAPGPVLPPEGSGSATRRLRIFMTSRNCWASCDCKPPRCLCSRGPY